MPWRYPAESRHEPPPPPRPPHAFEIPPHLVLAEGLEEVSRQIEALKEQIEGLRAEIRGLLKT